MSIPDPLRLVRYYDEDCTEIDREYRRRVDELNEQMAEAMRVRDTKKQAAYEAWQEAEAAEVSRDPE